MQLHPHTYREGSQRLLFIRILIYLNRLQVLSTIPRHFYSYNTMTDERPSLLPELPCRQTGSNLQQPIEETLLGQGWI